MHFAKYHGIGNDFLVVDLRSAPDTVANAWQDDGAVRALCDRQFGVGGDGVLAILPPVTTGSDARMRVLNADGSEAEMCGNGLRCVVKFLFDRDAALKKPALTIDTGAGALRCAVTADSRAARAITVDMGRPRLTRGEIPMTGPAGERCVAQPIEIPGDTTSRLVTAVSMGNPHAVVFVDSPAETRRLAETVGPALETHAWFPRKTNAEWAYVKSPREIDLVVWERGVGITNACGTGACATAVAACLTGRAQPGEEICVHLPGGDLQITVAADYSTVLMRGAAAHVFDADLEITEVLAAARPAR
jgi:diaminopimelate epimerase